MRQSCSLAANAVTSTFQHTTWAVIKYKKISVHKIGCRKTKIHVFLSDHCGICAKVCKQQNNLHCLSTQIHSNVKICKWLREDCEQNLVQIKEYVAINSIQLLLIHILTWIRNTSHQIFYIWLANKVYCRILLVWSRYCRFTLIRVKVKQQRRDQARCHIWSW